MIVGFKFFQEITGGGIVVSIYTFQINTFDYLLETIDFCRWLALLQLEHFLMWGDFRGLRGHDKPTRVC